MLLDEPAPTKGASVLDRKLFARATALLPPPVPPRRRTAHQDRPGVHEIAAAVGDRQTVEIGPAVDAHIQADDVGNDAAIGGHGVADSLACADGETVGEQVPGGVQRDSRRIVRGAIPDEAAPVNRAALVKLSELPPLLVSPDFHEGGAAEIIDHHQPPLIVKALRLALPVPMVMALDEPTVSVPPLVTTTEFPLAPTGRPTVRTPAFMRMELLMVRTLPTLPRPNRRSASCRFDSRPCWRGRSRCYWMSQGPGRRRRTRH